VLSAHAIGQIADKRAQEQQLLIPQWFFQLLLQVVLSFFSLSSQTYPKQTTPISNSIRYNIFGKTNGIYFAWATGNRKIGSRETPPLMPEFSSCPPHHLKVFD
jgi:hypothetical protein